MEILRRSWVQIQAFLGNLAPATRWLIGALVVILLLTGFLVVQYAASPEMVPLTQYASERQGDVLTNLQNAGIKAKQAGTQIVVPADQLERAYAELATRALLAPDSSAEFDKMVIRQTFWSSNAQNAQALVLAKQKVLSNIISKMTGVRSADVIVAIPQDPGLMRNQSRPSASVSVVMQAARPVGKPLAEAIANLVSGAFTEMKIADVAVMDSNAGRVVKIDNPDDPMMAGNLLELVRAHEDYYQKKIDDLLAYIPGAMIGVNVQLDPTSVTHTQKTEVSKNEPLKSEMTEETERHEAGSGGAEAGLRSNVGGSLDATGGGGGSTEKTTKTMTTYLEKPITGSSTSVIAGHGVKQIAVSVNVPRSYFVALATKGKSDAPDPDDAALKPVMDAELLKIQQQVEPLVSIADVKGVVRATMIPDRMTLLAHAGGAVGGAAAASIASTSGGLSGLAESGWAKTVGLGLLAVASLGLMLSMVRKATTAPIIPTVEELAGLPPTLPSEDDLVGEAEEVDPSMPAMELDEEELRTRKVSEQIAELIRANPVEAAGLVKRWVRTEE